MMISIFDITITCFAASYSVCLALEASRLIFQTRIRAAFETLEAEADAGRITCYGTATWTGFRVPVPASDYMSFQRLWDIAWEVGGDGHRFRALQLPFNLAMSEAFVMMM